VALSPRKTCFASKFAESTGMPHFSITWRCVAFARIARISELFRRFLGTKVDRPALRPCSASFPILCRVEKTDEGKTNVQFPGFLSHLKLDQLAHEFFRHFAATTINHYINGTSGGHRAAGIRPLVPRYWRRQSAALRFEAVFSSKILSRTSQVAGRAVSSHVMCCRTRHRQLTPVAYPGVSMIGLYDDSIVKIVISHHVQFSYLGLVFISSRDQAFFPQFFAALGPRYVATYRYY
jgi:hypothetical protein